MATVTAVRPTEGTSGNQYTDLQGRERCIYLATPKSSKAVWLTSLGPKLVWGNQETILPISKAAMQSEASPRIGQLSVPKKNFRSVNDGVKRIHVYSCGRNSVIWEVSPLAMKGNASHRVSELSRFKIPPAAFKEDRINGALSCGRESPIWEVSEAAKRAKSRLRLESLAKEKMPHRDYQPPREIESVVSDTAKKAIASARLESLSRAKSRPEGPFRDSKWPVSDLARNASATPRQLELAKPKGLVDGYQHERPVQRDISRASRRTIATTRTVDLARPIMRATMDHVQFNPDAFIVSDGAKRARCPPRIEELAQPMTRS
ncbi:testicular haploid expressed gene protein-like [Asterias rubens]|uniref:testicular haploid expressed gene protein-like n=1 Tax=Asterias rubens TaxID=7604 RepID=UPI0014557789|nr:testicular haploid expressed gene protein-like [Asterias rubens]